MHRSWCCLHCLFSKSCLESHRRENLCTIIRKDSTFQICFLALCSEKQLDSTRSTNLYWGSPMYQALFWNGGVNQHKERAPPWMSWQLQDAAMSWLTLLNMSSPFVSWLIYWLQEISLSWNFLPSIYLYRVRGIKEPGRKQGRDLSEGPRCYMGK